VVRHGFLTLLAGGLLCLSGLAFAGPAADRDRTDADAGTNAWGDPEDNEQADPGWTWFGMGYERRRRSSGAATVGGPENTNVPNGINQRGKQ